MLDINDFFIHQRPSMIPVLYLNEASSVCRDSDSYDWKRIGIKSLASINQIEETENSWSRRKINMERFRM
jgi:hypothetical protein